MKTTRSNVYEAINEERDYQDSLFSPGGKFYTPEEEPTRPHTVGEAILILEHYVTTARTAWNDEVGNEKALDMIRKVAAIAVRAMEENGVVLRTPPVSVTKA